MFMELLKSLDAKNVNLMACLLANEYERRLKGMKRDKDQERLVIPPPL